MADRRKIYGIIAAMLTIIIPYVIMCMDPHVESSQSLCPFKMLTGLPCPGCGITKSIIFLYKGELVRSLGYHIFGPVVILFCIIAILGLMAELITRKDYLNKLLYNSKLAYGAGFILATYHITRLIIFVSQSSVSDILKESIWR